MSGKNTIAVFFNGPNSVEAAMCLAAAGAPIHLLGKDRDELDTAGRQIIEAMDGLVRDGAIGSDKRFNVYSKVQKRVFAEMEEDVHLYMDAADTPEGVAQNDAFLETRPEGGVVLSLRLPGGPALGEKGNHARVLLSADAGLGSAKKVTVSLKSELPGELAKSVTSETAALLEAMGKEVVVD